MVSTTRSGATDSTSKSVQATSPCRACERFGSVSASSCSSRRTCTGRRRRGSATGPAGTAEGGADLVGVEGHDQVAALVLQGAERGPDGRDRRGVPGGGDGQLRAGQRGVGAHALSVANARIPSERQKPRSGERGFVSCPGGSSSGGSEGTRTPDPLHPCRCATSCATDPNCISTSPWSPRGTSAAYTIVRPGHKSTPYPGRVGGFATPSARRSPRRRRSRAGWSGSPTRVARASSTAGLPRGRRARRRHRSR